MVKNFLLNLHHNDLLSITRLENDLYCPSDQSDDETLFLHVVDVLAGNRSWDSIISEQIKESNFDSALISFSKVCTSNGDISRETRSLLLSFVNEWHGNARNELTTIEHSLSKIDPDDSDQAKPLKK